MLEGQALTVYLQDRVAFNSVSHIATHAAALERHVDEIGIGGCWIVVGGRGVAVENARVDPSDVEFWLYTLRPAPACYQPADTHVEADSLATPHPSIYAKADGAGDTELQAGRG